MAELVGRSSEEIEHVAFTIDPGTRDRHHGQPDPLRGLGLEHHIEHVHGGPGNRLGEWAVTVPRILRAERRIATSIDDGNFDVVVVHHQRHTQAPGLLRHLRTPSTYFVQEPRRQSFEHDLRPRILGNPAKRVIGSVPVRALDSWARHFDIESTRAATTLMCNSEHSREYIWRAYARDATVIPLGVDLDRFTPSPDPQADGNPPLTPHREILMVAAIERPKGIDLAIRAVASMAGPDRPTLRVVHNRADAAHCREIRELADDLGVSLVLEPGVSETELVDRYRQAAVCLLTSRLEPLGLTALEAAACGTPVVAIREGGYRETVIDGVTGLLTDRDPGSIAMALSRIVESTAGIEPSIIRSRVEELRPWSKAVARYIEVVARTSNR